MEQIFFKSIKDYTNVLNPVKGYLEQLTSYIQIRQGWTLERAKQTAIEILKTHFKDQPIQYFERQENGDRTVQHGSLLQYIKRNIKEKNILVPTFTSYVNSTVKKSILSEFIFVNVKKRSVAKKEAQKAKAVDDIELYISKNNEQSTMKIYNNSLSGAFAQMACVIHNPTGHSTLTSITRTMTSLSNASNELLIGGNRYYPRGVDVLNNIVYIVTYTDVEKIRQAVEWYQLHLPTVEETVKVLRYSSDNYWVDSRYYQTDIVPFLKKLNPYQLAAICYTGDLYHLRKFNSDQIRILIDALIQPIQSEQEILEDVNVLHQIDESILYFVHAIFSSQIKGYGKDYNKMNQNYLASSLYATALNVTQVLQRYQLFFNTFFMTEMFPPNSFRLKNMRRRVVVLSDTDSTCFTTDEWVKWHRGEFIIDSESIGLSACITYIASQTIVNQLSILSKNMNVEKDLLRSLSMKTEYLWKNFIPAEVSKHYFASTAIQEGNVYKEHDIECKGVHLKNSAVPKHIVEHGKLLMKYVLDTLAENKKVQFNYVLTEIITLEKEIIESVNKGEAKYLKKSKIKNKEAYAQDETKSPYQRHQFWLDVFAPKYGEVQSPPYDVIKIPTTIRTTRLLNEWLNILEDLELKNRLQTWLVQYKKKNLPTVYINELYITGNGIPSEIIQVIDVKRIVFDITMQHRIILETLGVLLNEDLLISEQFSL